MDLLIRQARLEDAESLVRILNPIIEAGIYTALDGPLTSEFERRFIESFPPCGILYVAEARQNGRVLGFQCAEPFADYSHTFDHVAIIGTYVDLSWQGQGVARQLSEATFEAAKKLGFEKLFAYVLADNARGLAFYSKLGFRIVGTARRQAKIGQRYVDEVMIEKFL